MVTTLETEITTKSVFQRWQQVTEPTSLKLLSVTLSSSSELKIKQQGSPWIKAQVLNMVQY